MAVPQRDTKWTEANRATILKWIGMSYHREVAAARARVSESQIGRWLKQGEIERNTWAEYIEGGGDPDDPDAPKYTEHAKFFDDLHESEAQAQVNLLTPVIESENNEDRKWVAERLYAKQWGKAGKMQVEHSGPGGRPIEIVDARRELFNRLDGMLGRDSGDEPGA